MSSVVFASPLKAASPIAQSVYDPAAVARPILKRDADPSVLFDDATSVLPAAPSARPTSKPIKKPMPLPARADPRFNPVTIAKSEASLSTRIFLQTKPHAGEAVVGAQRFLAFNRDSELRQFKRQLADTVPVTVAIGENRSFVDYLQMEPVASGFADECAGDALDGFEATLHPGLADDDGMHTNTTAAAAAPQYPVDHSSEDGFGHESLDASSLSSDEDGEINALLAASGDASESHSTHRSPSATETDSLASSHSETDADTNADVILPFMVAPSPVTSVTPARVPLRASPLPVKTIHSSSPADFRNHTPTSYSALHAARISPPVDTSSSSSAKAASWTQAPHGGASQAAGATLRSAVMIAPPPSFAGLSKYSQQMVIEMTNIQQLEAQSSAKIAQRDLSRLRDSFQKVSSAGTSHKQLSKTNSRRLAAKPSSSPAIHGSKQVSHLNEPTPPRSRRPVPNSVVSEPVRPSILGLYDIDDADASTPLSRCVSATITPKQHRSSCVTLPSVSPFFQTPERPSIVAAPNHIFSSLSPLSVALHIPLPTIDSVPCTPRPSTPPQPIQSQSSVDNTFTSRIPHHNQMMQAPENVKFSDLEAPQAPPYPDLLVDRSAHDVPSESTVAPAELPKFESLFELTNDRDHDVFAAISALSAPLESLVVPESRFDPRLWLSVIDTDADIGVRIQRMQAAFLVTVSLVQKDEAEVKSSFKRLNELRVDLLWQTKRRQLRFWLNSSGHIVLGPRKREVVMKFLGLTPASKHAKSISIREPSPGCPGVSADKRWQGSDFKIQLMLSLVSKYQLHLAFVQFKMNAARARAIRHVSACLSLANSRRYILLGWSCFRSWHYSRLHTRDVAIRSGSNKWIFLLQMVLQAWSRFVSSHIKRQRSLAQFQHRADVQTTTHYYKRWSSSVKIRKHGVALSSAACQFWYLTCSLRCMLRWWQGVQNLVARKRALRAFAGTNSGNVLEDSQHLSSEAAFKPRCSLSKADLDEQLRLKQMLAVRRRKQLLTPLKILLQQRKLAVAALYSNAVVPDPPLSRKAGPSTSDVAISAAARRLFSRTFFFWKDVSNTSMRAKDLMIKIELGCKNRAFVFWKYIGALHRGFSSLAARMQHSCSKRALSLWLIRARLEKRCLQSISNRCRLRLLHSVVSSWKIVGHIDALASDWRLKRHFAMWQRALPIIWLDQDREGTRLNQLRTSRSVFCRWQSHVHRNKRLLALLLRGQLLYCKHLLVVVWTSWRLATAAASLRSGTLKRLSSRRNLRYAGDAFACWISHLGKVRLLRRVFHAAAERWHLVLTLNSDCARSDMHVMADHFCKWQLDAKATKQERLLKSIYATAVVYQSIRRRRIILHSWSRWAYCRFTARQHFARARHTLLRGIVSSWASLAVITKALVWRVEVRQRRKRLEGCIASMRAAVRNGRCRRGPVARRYFGTLKWYCQTFCRDLPKQHRSGVVQQRVIQAWSSQRLISLKVALGAVMSGRYLSRRVLAAWTVHTGDRKRAIISHRLANAHSTYSSKKRVFCALKRQLADAARYFYLLGKALLSNSKRRLSGGFQLWKAAAAIEREQRLAPGPSGQMTAATALPVVFEAAPSRMSSSAALSQFVSINAEQASAAPQPQRAVDTLLSDARAGASSEALLQSFRAIPVTVSHSASAASSGQLPKAIKSADSQRVSRENVAPQRVLAQQRAATGGGKAAEAARATHGTQTLAASKPKKPPLVVEHVPQRSRMDGGGGGIVVGRAVVSSFLLSDLRSRAAALSPPASPRMFKLN